MAWDDWFRKDSGSKDNIFKYWWRTTLPGFITNLVSRAKSRGYQFGDIVQSAFGMRYDPNSAGGNASEFGQTVNDVTGVTAANNTQKELLQREQDFTAEQNQLNRDLQLYMSNTAYQRAMQDAEQAGLNPYYVVSGGGNSGAGIANGAGSTAVTAPATSGNSGVAVAAAIHALTGLLATAAKAAK